MRLSEQAINEFLNIYKDEIGKNISREDAEQLALQFLLLTKAIYKPLKITSSPTTKPLSENLLINKTSKTSIIEDKMEK